MCAKAKEGMLRVYQGVADLSIYLHLLLHVAIATCGCVFSPAAVVLVCGFVTLLPLPSTLVGGYAQCIAAGLIMM